MLYEKERDIEKNQLGLGTRNETNTTNEINE